MAAGPGRKSIFSDLIASKIILAIRSGAMRRAAAEAAGIGHRTLGRWIAKGRKDLASGTDSEYAGFAAAVRGAESTAENDAASRVFADDPKWWLIHARCQNWAVKRELRELNKLIKELQARLAQHETPAREVEGEVEGEL